MFNGMKWKIEYNINLVFQSQIISDMQIISAITVVDEKDGMEES